ncbi:hypothetical protein DICPUDRAFT_51357 [Dictyostelium purpureum]|uniref:Peptidase M20 dimerisation domain-containing protein n=1 Tax=Dictyostelium purpureum TaxID=5786 RepID=F1A3C8_DICPU|nr:uncharacterized protein DICPUDRAFT_51357 [Dictyostelium purpureum]EGC29301.1 hypothetical protein DICPUDRAFT_51357 [Dictyostelium purpureum]|eukprot:XP_003294169.1 hypothetical protein DICPUDRAFT_51357 [Dictyostelium purpureum]
MELNKDRFITLLTKFIAESKNLQNLPPKFVPREDLIALKVLDVLKPFTKENGGVLNVQHIHLDKANYPERGHVIIEYPGTSKGTANPKTFSIVGSHMDVVPADETKWDPTTPPFKLTHKTGTDEYFGRGTTDCLGHVALVTDLFLELATHKPQLKQSVFAVFIVSEENTDIPNIGVDDLQKAGYLDNLKHGPVIWLDSADMFNTIATGGALTWELTAFGKNMHSAMPNRTVNSLELVNEACAEIQKRFYTDFPAHPKEKEYNFEISSTMKPTLWKEIQGSFNTIPGQATICGDIRLSPFYEVSDLKAKVASYVKDINENITKLRSRGPYSKYDVPEYGVKGRIELVFHEEVDEGIACDLTSAGYKALVQATTEAIGPYQPVSTLGTLPLVRNLQRQGMDIQITGFGVEDVYHADNEFLRLGDFVKGFQILNRTIELVEKTIN